MAIDLKTLARYGAQARIDELQNEIDEIRREFPGETGKKRGRPAKSASATVPAVEAPKRGRKPMSAAAKKAVITRKDVALLSLLISLFSLSCLH